MRLSCVFFVVLLTARVALASDLAPERVMDHSVPARLGGTLTVDLGSGGTLRIRGSDEPRVLVHARLGGRDWRATRVSLVPASGGARLQSSLMGSRDELSTSHEFDVVVPHQYDVEIQSAGGDIRIANVEGEFSGTTRGGSIVLDRVRGRADLATRGGNVEISDSHLDGRVTTRGGAVSLSHVTGGVQTSSRSSGEDAKRDDARRIDLRGGPIDLDDAPQGTVVRTGGGPIVVRRAEGSIDASTGGGNIEIGPTSGGAKAVTGAGDIRVTIARNLVGSETVELRSGLGNVTLQLPSDFDGALDLRTGYTESFGRATRIQCDWKLNIERTGLLENGGTPQHYVLGTGSAGTGTGRVVIRTTNGDIAVKRSQP